MGGDLELGVLRANGAMLLRERITGRFVIEALTWLRHENAGGAHIFVRPAGLSPFTLIELTYTSRLTPLAAAERAKCSVA